MKLNERTIPTLSILKKVFAGKYDFSTSYLEEMSSLLQINQNPRKISVITLCALDT